jgi:plastocyanin
MLRKHWRVGLVCAFVIGTMACGGGSAPAPSGGGEPAAAASASGNKVDAATAGEVNGKVVLEGAPGPNDPIKMNSDPVCVKENKGTPTQEYFVVGDGGALGNVFVYVKDGLGNYVYDEPTQPATIDQKGCKYTPHVFGVRVGQKLVISNSDPTLHNIHAIPKANQEFNTGQPIQGMKTEHTFTAKEVMVPFKCDVHGWMNAHVGVLDHPYFATTGTDGSFSLKSLPPGTYTIEAWHEKLGATTQSVTVGPKETKTVSFTFKKA